MPESPPEQAPPAKRRFWQSEPMDEHGQRTMFVGLIISFSVYALSFVITAIYKTAAWANWLSMALILSSVVFLSIWFISVRRGFRLGKVKSRAERRAKMHAKEEREKRMRLNR